MTTKLGPWDVGFPVRFRANGDTVHDAFYKHIQEIERIYGLLNALDSNKLDWSDMQAHIQSANPHPNLTISGDKITGAITNAKIPIDNVTGNIPASRVYGTLTNAYIDHSHVNGLSNVINSAIKEDTPVDDKTYSNNGYVKFKGGFMIEWGVTPDLMYDGAYVTEEQRDYTFHTPFSNKCLQVILTVAARGEGEKIDKGDDCYPILNTYSITKTGFSASINDPDSNPRQLRLHYIALGY